MSRRSLSSLLKSRSADRMVVLPLRRRASVLDYSL
jgi:hypothetical protein